MLNKFFTLLLILTVPAFILINSGKAPVEQANPSSPVINLYQIHQTIKSGDNIIYEADVPAYPGESAFDLLNRTQKIEIKQYSFGKLVTDINGLSNGVDNKYWTYYVNNQEASSSADSYKLKPNDVIFWKFSAQ